MFADLQPVGIPQRQDGEIIAFDLDQSDLRSRVGADHLGIGERAAVLECDRHPVHVADHVVVRENVAVPADDEPGALPPFADTSAENAAAARRPEEPAEEVLSKDRSRRWSRRVPAPAG